MESATSLEQVPLGAFYVGSVQGRRKCGCPGCCLLPFDGRGLEFVGDGVYRLTLLHPREESFKTRELLEGEATK